MRQLFAALSIVLIALTAPPRAAEPNWHVTATVAESCSCTISAANRTEIPVRATD
jgi:hypothetical protein